jgi:hypothetical protein
MLELGFYIISVFDNVYIIHTANWMFIDQDYAFNYSNI